jgi:phospholipid/cholesterol/gamma-HCH transport system permease protein
MATVIREPVRLWRFLRAKIADAILDLGDLSLFAWRILTGLGRRSSYNTLLPISYAIGVNSIPVVMITGAFIGMVLAVQAYSEFAHLGLATRLGQIINISVVRELGPVLAAVMLAGRVGSAMAAELATMRITEQIDALACLGTNPVHYLGTPRFLACMLLIPLLTILANFMGVLGGAVICIDVYHVESHYYWENTRGFVGMYDLLTGLIKPTFFGAAIGIICCHRGFYSEAGAEGVGRAATRAFVLSFIAILVLDFFLAMFLNNLYDYLWPTGSKLL